MHVTDWLPTLLDFGGCDAEFGGKPLDGVSQLNPIWSKMEDRYQTKNEILHYMNPLLYTVGSEDPRGDWKNDHGGPLKNRCFSINVRAVIRVGKWKLHTGLGSKEGDNEVCKPHKTPEITYTFSGKLERTTSKIVQRCKIDF